MEIQEELRRVIAQYFETDPTNIHAQFPLSGRRMENSLARYALDAAIRRRIGKTCPEVHTAKTYGELETALTGAPMADAAIPAPPAVPNAPLDPTAIPTPDPISVARQLGLSCGIDIELIDAMPEAKDYWTDSFYSACFTAVEIAYCLTQDNPRMHFAGRWCAKEAAKKCQPDLLPLNMNQLELVRETTGAVYLKRLCRTGPQRLPLSISISHTSLMAVAIVIGQP